MNVATAPTQSNFVTVLAWILIVFGGLGVAMALMQNAMVYFIVPVIDQLPSSGSKPMESFPMVAFRIMAALMLVVAAFLTYAAFALLKRRNWARRTYIVLFVLGAAWNVIYVVGFGFMFLFGKVAPSATPLFPPDIRPVFVAMTITFGTFALAMAVLLVWLAKRLHSPAIKSEFRPVGSVT